MVASAVRLKQRAHELGFNLVGITPATPSPTLDAYLRWIARGMHGTMGYMARPDRQARRRDLNVILPGVQSLVMVGLDYRSFAVPDSTLQDPSRGRIASYAWNLDYHESMTPRLDELATWLQAESGQVTNQRVYVDTGASLERSHAQQAGMGFVGKNTMLIHPRRGSYFFLGEILTDLEFDDYDNPHRPTLCGNCTRCLSACPTDAFPEPYVLDSRRCISYLTIEHKGWIDHNLRPLMGNWIYGCDICQDACPFQRFANETQESAFKPVDLNRVAPRLVDVLALDGVTFKRYYYDSPIYRIKRERMVRNACVAAANGKIAETVPLLIALLEDDGPLVRGHAAWALWQIAAESAAPVLKRRYDREPDPDVRQEIELVLE
jgi:epoxyqueuosine reductase